MNNIKSIVLALVAVLSMNAVSFAASAHIDLIELRGASIKDAAKILARMSHSNISVTSEVADLTVDLMLREVSLKHAVETLSRITGTWYRFDKRNSSYLLMSKQQYQESISISRNDDFVRSFTLKHQNVIATARTIQSLFGDRVSLDLQQDLDLGGGFEGIPRNLMKSHVESSDIKVETKSRVQLSSTALGLHSNRTSTQKVTFKEGGLSGKDFENDAKLRSLSEQSNIDTDIYKKLGVRTSISITVNRIHNLMFVRTSDEQAMDDIEQLIKESDKPTPQVLLEMKIIKIGDSEGFEQEFDISFNDSFNVDGVSYESGSSVADILTGTANLEYSGDTGIGSVTQILNQIAGNSITKLGFNSAQGGFYEFYSKYINAKIEFLEKNEVAEAIAKPILLASNNQAARLFIGEDQVIAIGMDAGSINQVDNGNTTSTTETETSLETEIRKIGSTLVLVPSINDDRTVTIDIFQETSTLKRKGMDFPFFNTDTNQIESVLLDTVEVSSLKSIVVAKDGYTIALGGMINESTRNEYSSVPILSDIPFIGELFKTKSEKESSGQYIMLITPHIIMTPDEGSIRSKEIEEINFNKYTDDSVIAASIKVSGGLNDRFNVSDFIAQSRYMAKERHGREVKIDADIIDMKVDSNLIEGVFEDSDLLLQPLRSYLKNGFYSTLVEVRNTGNQRHDLDLSKLAGNWLAVSKEQPYLSPYKQVIDSLGDQSYLYFVSNKPFERVIAEIR